jgi:hypothetical protein
MTLHEYAPHRSAQALALQRIVRKQAPFFVTRGAILKAGSLMPASTFRTLHEAHAVCAGLRRLRLQ